MMGHKPTMQDISLENIEELVLPLALLCEESLSPDDIPEEEPLSPYRVDSYCYSCNCGVRLFVVATLGNIHLFQDLLLGDFSILCPRCSRDQVHYGKHHQ